MLLKEPMLFQNICSVASRVQDCWNLAKTRVRKKQTICPAPKYCIFKIASVIHVHAWCKKKSKTVENLIDRNLHILV